MRFGFLSLTLALLSIATASAATLRVPADYPTIQSAIDTARDGDTVVIASGEYEEALWVLGLALTLQAEGGDVTIAPQASIALCISEEASVQLRGLTLHGQGGALLVVNSNAAMRDCTLASEHAPRQANDTILFRRARVELIGCEVNGPRPVGDAAQPVLRTDGLTAAIAGVGDLILDQCTVRGGDGLATTGNPASGGNGIEIFHGHLVAHESIVMGGRPDLRGWTPANGGRIAAGTAVFCRGVTGEITGATLTGGEWGDPRGAADVRDGLALHLTQGSRVELRESVLTSGQADSVLGTTGAPLAVDDTSTVEMSACRVGGD